MMNALFESNSWIAIAMITDLLARKDRFNVPGTAAKSNWSRRMQKTVAGLDGEPSDPQAHEIHPGAAGEERRRISLTRESARS